MHCAGKTSRAPSTLRCGHPWNLLADQKPRTIKTKHVFFRSSWQTHETSDSATTTGHLRKIIKRKHQTPRKTNNKGQPALICSGGLQTRAAQALGLSSCRARRLLAAGSADSVGPAALLLASLGAASPEKEFEDPLLSHKPWRSRAGRTLGTSFRRGKRDALSSRHRHHCR